MGIIRLSPSSPVRKGLLGNWRFKRNLPLYFMFLPMIAFLIVFSFLPMYGALIAFQDYDVILGFRGSPFVGLEHFRRIVTDPDIWRITRNTVVIAVGKIVFSQLASLTFALLLNEVRITWYKRTVQTVSYVLNFVSWVVMAGLLFEVLSLNGLANKAITAVGLPAVSFLGSAKIFPLTMIGTDVFKGFGFGAIIYLAGLAGIDPNLYEAAAVDGANRWQRIRHITLPGLTPTVILLLALSLGGVLNAGFEQILLMYNPMVFSTGDILDTYVYRATLLGGQFSFGTAVGLVKAVVGAGLLALSYWLADRLAGYRIF